MPFQTSNPVDAAQWLRSGQTLEAGGTSQELSEAVQCYDHAIRLLQDYQAGDTESIQELAIAWMNRGNVLQKHSSVEAIQRAVESYDQAIALFSELPSTDDSALINSLGAAWLNRAHALQQLGISHQSEAIRSCEQAVTILGRLPLETHLAGRLNLAGAHINFAHLILASTDKKRYEHAHAAAAAALKLSVEHELKRAGFAEIGLKARRVLCEVIGQWLIESNEPPRHHQLIATASDAVDTGLTLARRWESLDASQFRPLAERLFRFGTAFYRRHQPHFLADFVLENVDCDHTSDAFQNYPAIHTIAHESLTATRQDLRTQFPVVAQDFHSERRLQTLKDIESALTRLNAIAPPSHDIS